MCLFNRKHDSVRVISFYLSPTISRSRNLELVLVPSILVVPTIVHRCAYIITYNVCVSLHARVLCKPPRKFPSRYFRERPSLVNLLFRSPNVFFYRAVFVTNPPVSVETFHPMSYLKTRAFQQFSKLLSASRATRIEYRVILCDVDPKKTKVLRGRSPCICRDRYNADTYCSRAGTKTLGTTAARRIIYTRIRVNYTCPHSHR